MTETSVLQGERRRAESNRCWESDSPFTPKQVAAIRAFSWHLDELEDEPEAPQVTYDPTLVLCKENRRTIITHIAARDGCHSCFYCEVPYAPVVEHVRPRRYGGSDSIENLVLSCNRCNFEKSTAPVWYFVFRAVGKGWFPGFEQNPQGPTAPLEPSLAVSPGETRVCAHQRGER